MFESDGAKYLTVKEAAEIAGVTLSSVYYWTRHYLSAVSPHEVGLEGLTSVRVLIPEAEFSVFLALRARK